MPQSIDHLKFRHPKNQTGKRKQERKGFEYEKLFTCFIYLILKSFEVNPFYMNRPVADWAKSSGIKQFLFISSAGIYKPTDEPPHVEGV